MNIKINALRERWTKLQNLTPSDERKTASVVIEQLIQLYRMLDPSEDRKEAFLPECVQDEMEIASRRGRLARLRGEDVEYQDFFGEWGRMYDSKEEFTRALDNAVTALLSQPLPVPAPVQEKSMWDKDSWTDTELKEMIRKDTLLLELLEERPDLFGHAVIAHLRLERNSLEGFLRARKDRR